MTPFLHRLRYRGLRALPVSSGSVATLLLAYLVLGPFEPSEGLKRLLGIAVVVSLQGIAFFLGAALGVAEGHRTSKVGEFMAGSFSGLVVILGSTVVTSGLMVTAMPARDYLAAFAPLVVATGCGIGMALWLTRSRCSA